MAATTTTTPGTETKPQIEQMSSADNENDLKTSAQASRNDKVPEGEILDEFDFSYIPDDLKELICGPGAYSDDQDGENKYSNTKASDQINSLLGKRGKLKKKRPKHGDGDDDEEEELEDEYDEDESVSSGESGTTEDDNPFAYRDEDSDNVTSDTEEKQGRRYLIGKDSFLELADPDLDHAFDSSEEDDEEENEEEEATHKSRSQRRQERHDYKELCKQMGVLPLGRFLRSMHTDTVDLSRYQLTPPEIVAVCKTMENNIYVKNINLSGNPAGAEGGEAIAKMLENNYTLTNVNIAATGILPVFKKICDAVGRNVMIESLDLSQNNLGDAEMKSVGQMLKDSTTLTHLNLSHNKIRDQGAQYLGQALKENTSLISLNLAVNEMKGEKQSAVLFHALAEHPTLEKIDFYNNTLQDQIGKGVSKLLSANKQLHYMDIARNVFDNPGAKAIGGGFYNAGSMLEFVVGPNEWNSDGSAALLRPLLTDKTSPDLATIDFGWLHDVYTPFLQVEEKVKTRRPDLNIIRGEAYGQAKAKNPDKQVLLIKRAKIVCENFVTPLEMLIDELRKEPPTMTAKEFKKFIKSCNLYKDKSLTAGFIRQFEIDSFKVDCKKIIEVYDKVFPKSATAQPLQIGKISRNESAVEQPILQRKPGSSFQISW